MRIIRFMLYLYQNCIGNDISKIKVSDKQRIYDAYCKYRDVRRSTAGTPTCHTTFNFVDGFSESGLKCAREFSAAAVI